MAANVPGLKVRNRWKGYLRVLLPSAVVVGIVFLLSVGYLSYKVTFPDVAADGNPSNYALLDYRELDIPGVSGSAWFLKGDAGAPAIFLCHDYAFNRLSGVNLARVLHESGYNIFVISFRGHSGDGHSGTTLGLLEGVDLASAVDYGLSTADLDPKRVGVWGVGLGAHAALRAALKEERIAVLALDSPYSAVSDFLNYQVERRMGFRSRIIGGSVGLFSAAYSGRTPLALYEQISPALLRDVPILYLVGADSPLFVQWARQLHSLTTGPKDLRVLPRSRRSVLATPEWRGYDLQVVEFFEKYLPVSQQASKGDGPRPRHKVPAESDF